MVAMTDQAAGPAAPRRHQVAASEIAALEDLGGGGSWGVDGVELTVTNLDKVLFPAAPATDDHPARDAVTKRDYLRHLANLAPAILPYLEGRAVNAVRHPNGTAEDGFWAKAAPKRAPGWMTTWDNPRASTGETRTYVVVDRPATLLFLGNLAAVELHPWTSSVARSDEPDWALVDLDPGTDTSWADLLLLARMHRTALDQLGVTAAAKVTGKRGIQVWIPVAPGHSFADTLAWVEKLSAIVGHLVPDLVSWEWEVAARRGKARLDYTQNVRNKTLVAPWSTRAAAGAPVSVPITWDELDDPDLRPDRWSVHTAAERYRASGDPMRPLIGLAQRLPAL
jgi:bifunctional non-homologous end joining protein LigD